MENPLLTRNGLPPFDRILPEHVVPAVRQVLAEAEAELARIEAAATPTWEGLMAPLEGLDLPFETAWAPVTHLMGVQNSEALREAHDTVLPEVVAFGLRLAQSRPVYEGLRELRDGPAWDDLDPARRRAVALRLRAAEHAGVGLEGEARRRFSDISRELSQLATGFSNHVLDATRQWVLDIEDAEDAAGWPEGLRHLTAQSYNRAHETDRATAADGPWRITLDPPVFLPFLQHCRNRTLRETVYRAYVARAASGDLDNTPLIERILRLREEKAALLGFATYAELSLSEKAAPDVAGVDRMLAQLLDAARPHARRDLSDLEAAARAGGQTAPLAHWDVAFWSERLRERRFDFTDDQLRPYFPLERVLAGLFSLAERLFGVAVSAADGRAPVWHPDVRYFQVVENGAPIAFFYLDPYSRPHEKRGGAWMDNCLSRRRVDGRLRLPVAHVCCNATPPAGDRPSLMSFAEVETLFHEFGHALQAMLTRAEPAAVSGIEGIEWDAVEVASQFMENWCTHRPTLESMAVHYRTGAPLPEDLVEKIIRAKTFRAGSLMIRQLEFAMTDMELHHRHRTDGPETARDVHRRIAGRVNVLPPFEDDRFLCAFSHIFGGGYAAGYYAYKFSEVMSADCFAAFEEAGLDDPASVAAAGRRYRDTLLALGGSRPPLEVFEAFRGRPPQVEHLLRHNGLVPPTETA